MTEHERKLRAALRAAAAEYPAAPAELPGSLLHAVSSGAQPAGVASTLVLLRAQWPLLARGRLLPALVLFVALVFSAAAGATGALDLLVLTAALPVAAALFVALLSGPGVDPAHQVVVATRTAFGAVVFARTTVALALLVALSLPASVVVSLVTGKLMAPLITVWLGPTVLLGAFATLLAQVAPRLVAVSAALGVWTITVVAIYLEQTTAWAPSPSFVTFLEVGWVGALAQAALGAGLLAAGWAVAVRDSGRWSRA